MPIIPFAYQRRRFWNELSKKASRRLLNAIPSRAYYVVFRVARREIVTRAYNMGIPKERLREHFDALLREGIPKMQIGEKMLEDLKEAEELKHATDVKEEHFRNFLKNRPLAAALEEMREHAQAMQQMQQRAA